MALAPLVVVMPGELAEEAFEMAAKLAASQAVSLLDRRPGGGAGSGGGAGCGAMGIERSRTARPVCWPPGWRKPGRGRRQGAASPWCFSNQTRSPDGGRREKPTPAPAAPSLKLYASVRIELEPVGEPGLARFRVLKNKAGCGVRAGANCGGFPRLGFA